MPDSTSATLSERFSALVGKPVGAAEAASAPDPVNQPMIRHWATAMEDANPVYTDPAFAATSRFGGIVSPPFMLQTWTMPTPKITGIAERGGSPVELSGENPLAVFDEAGFIATLATNTEFEIVRYVQLGEQLSSTTVIDAVSEEKTTRLGSGHFITWKSEYRDAAGEVVGRQWFRILKFKPAAELLG